MARTAAGAELTRQHRRAQLALRAAMLRDLVALWRTVDPTDLRGTIGPFATAGSAVVRARHRDSATLAAGYYRQFREAEQVPGQAEPRLADPLPAEVAAGTLLGAGLAGIIGARRGGLSVGAAAQRGLVSVSGSAISMVLSGGRRTVLRSGQADPRAARWQRITGDDPCAFCAMLASRGAVFSTADTGGFEAHDGCSCEVEIAYEGSQMTAQAREFRRQWDEAQREARESGELKRGTANDALNAFRRARGG